MSNVAIGPADTVPAGSYLEIEFTYSTPTGGTILSASDIMQAVTAAGYDLVNQNFPSAFAWQPVLNVFINVQTTDAAGNIGKAIADALNNASALVFGASATNYWIVSQSDASSAAAPPSSGPSISSTVYISALAIIVVVVGFFLFQAERA